jgi:predicted Zn-dependent protease with MMP-like domain
MSEVSPDEILASDAAEALAEEVYAELDRDPVAGLAFARAVPAPLAQHPLLRLALAHAIASVEGEAAARGPLEALVRDEPDFADARHSLALVYEALDRPKDMIAQFVEVHRIDSHDDRVAGFDLISASSTIIQLAKAVIEELPEDFRNRLRAVPVVVEERPLLDIVQEGFDPRSVGLFEGKDHGERFFDTSHMPPRIVLYAANLTASLDPSDPDALAHEVEITVLHEIGHYFGLDEERLDELGLG